MVLEFLIILYRYSSCSFFIALIILFPYLEMETARLSWKYLLKIKMEAMKNVRCAHALTKKLLIKKKRILFGV